MTDNGLEKVKQALEQAKFAYPSFGGAYLQEAIEILDQHMRGGWRPIETAEDDGSIFLVWGAGGMPYVARKWSGGWQELHNHSINLRKISLPSPKPTHWLCKIKPLPAPPKEGEK